MSIITKKIKDEVCYRCNGEKVKPKTVTVDGKSKIRWEICKSCGGTGRFIEHYSYYIDDEKGIVFGGEPGK